MRLVNNRFGHRYGRCCCCWNGLTVCRAWYCNICANVDLVIPATTLVFPTWIIFYFIISCVCWQTPRAPVDEKAVIVASDNGAGSGGEGRGGGGATALRHLTPDEGDDRLSCNPILSASGRSCRPPPGGGVGGGRTTAQCAVSFGHGGRATGGGADRSKRTGISVARW